MIYLRSNSGSASRLQKSARLQWKKFINFMEDAEIGVSLQSEDALTKLFHSKTPVVAACNSLAQLAGLG